MINAKSDSNESAKGKGDSFMRKAMHTMCSHCPEATLDVMILVLTRQLLQLPDSPSQAKNMGFLYGAISVAAPCKVLHALLPLLHARCIDPLSLTREISYSLLVASQVTPHCLPAVAMSRAVV